MASDKNGKGGISVLLLSRRLSKTDISAGNRSIGGSLALYWLCMVLAMLAPRPVMLIAGETDAWSDPYGEFLAARLAQRLQSWTGVRWGVSIVGSGGAATIAETRAEIRGDLHARAAAHPLVQAVLAAFPGAVIKDVRPPEPVLEPAPAEADVTEDDDWDPFDPFAQED